MQECRRGVAVWVQKDAVWVRSALCTHSVLSTAPLLLHSSWFPSDFPWCRNLLMWIFLPLRWKPQNDAKGVFKGSFLSFFAVHEQDNVGRIQREAGAKPERIFAVNLVPTVFFTTFIVLKNSSRIFLEFFLTFLAFRYFLEVSFLGAKWVFWASA